MNWLWDMSLTFSGRLYFFWSSSVTANSSAKASFRNLRASGRVRMRRVSSNIWAKSRLGLLEKVGFGSSGTSGAFFPSEVFFSGSEPGSEGAGPGAWVRASAIGANPGASRSGKAWTPRAGAKTAAMIRADSPDPVGVSPAS